MSEQINIFPWNTNFCCGIDDIDIQHQNLVIILNKLANQTILNCDKNELITVINELIAYTKYHFETEEKLWQAFLPNHTDANKHQQEHQRFINKIAQLKTEFETTPSDELLKSLIIFLTNWLAAHILENDFDLAIQVQALQKGATLEQAKAQAKQHFQGASRQLINVTLSLYAAFAENTLYLIEQSRKNNAITRALEKSEHRLEEALTFSEVGYWDLDIETGEAICDPQMYQLYGLNKHDETNLSTLLSLMHLQFHEAFHQSLQNCIKTGKEHRVQYTITRPSDGQVRWIHCRGKRIINPLDNSISLSGFSQDITLYKQTELKLIEQQQQLQFITDNSPFYIASCDKNGRYIYASQPYAKLFDLTPEAIIGRKVQEIVGKAVYRELNPHIIKVLSGETVSYDINLFGQSLLVQYVPSFDERKNVTGYITGITNITERKQVEQKLLLAAKVFDSQEGILITDAKENILQVNTSFTDITGFDAEELIGKHPSILCPENYDEQFYREVWPNIADQDAWEGEVWQKHKDGHCFPAYLYLDAVKNEHQITNYIITINDITLRKKSEQKIQQLAFYDQLTNLPNRRLLLDRLRRVIALSNHQYLNNALLFLDIDHFKMLNDTHGHDMGDLLLTSMAERLESCVRKEDTLARIGGDEFVIILEGLSADKQAATDEVNRICGQILLKLQTPFHLNAIEFKCTTSIGVTLFGEQTVTTSELMKRADIAMYQAKQAGRNTVRFFNPQMQAEISQRMKLESELHQAVKEQQFELFYQVQINHQMQPTGAEALLRWRHPTKGIVTPIEFIPQMEESGLIVELGYWILNSACEQLDQWQQNSHTKNLTLSINVSSKQFKQAQFVEQCREIIHRYHIAPQKLKMELTESLLLDDINGTIKQMHSLNALGILFSLDDFGTGYSSLQYLKKLPLYQLKIDRSFVDELTTNNSDQSIVKMIIAMANSLGVNVIAEGVETLEQQHALTQMGCEHYQGYRYSKPLPIDIFEQYIQQASINAYRA
ncbi:bacteriohemerythrin [Shewanella gaetbuli]